MEKENKKPETDQVGQVGRSGRSPPLRSIYYKEGHQQNKLSTPLVTSATTSVGAANTNCQHLLWGRKEPLVSRPACRSYHWWYLGLLLIVFDQINQKDDWDGNAVSLSTPKSSAPRMNLPLLLQRPASRLQMLICCFRFCWFVFDWKRAKIKSLHGCRLDSIAVSVFADIFIELTNTVIQYQTARSK